MTFLKESYIKKQLERWGKMKTVIVACGSGVATSQTVASKVEQLCKERKIPVKVMAVDIKSLEQNLRIADVYISITPITKEYDIPTINGIPFLTGVGIDEVMGELEKILRE